MHKSYVLTTINSSFHRLFCWWKISRLFHFIFQESILNFYYQRGGGNPTFSHQHLGTSLSGYQQNLQKTVLLLCRFQKNFHLLCNLKSTHKSHIKTSGWIWKLLGSSAHWADLLMCLKIHEPCEHTNACVGGCHSKKETGEIGKDKRDGITRVRHYENKW